MSAIFYLSHIEFGLGSLATLPEALTGVGIAKPLFVSDHGLAAQGIVDRVAVLLPNGAPRVLDVPSNPTEDAVISASEVYTASGADGIVAVGGGSPIDLAKGVALIATHPPPLEQYAAILGGMARIRSSVSPVIAIPTTAGTGAEVGPLQLGPCGQ
jgi:4-hydroxybutyrate dehydrogenase